MRSFLLLSALIAVSTASVGNVMLESNLTTTIDNRDWPDTTTDTNSITIHPFIGPSPSAFVFPSKSIYACTSGRLAKLPASRGTISRRSDGTAGGDRDNLGSTESQDSVDGSDDKDDDDGDENGIVDIFTDNGVSALRSLIGEETVVSTVAMGPSTTKSMTVTSDSTDLPSLSTSLQSTTLTRTVNGTRTGPRSSSSSSRFRSRQTSTLRTRTRSKSSRLSTTRSSSFDQSSTGSTSSASPTTTVTSTVDSTSATTRTLYSDGFPSSTTIVIKLVEPSSSINASSTVLVLVQPHVHSTTTILSTISTVSLQVSPTTSSTRSSSVRSSTTASRRSSVHSSTSTRTKTLTETVSLPRFTKTSTRSMKSTMASTKTSTSQGLTVILDIVSTKTKTTTARPSNITIEVVSTETTTARASTFLVEVAPKPTRRPPRSSVLTASTSTTTITVYPSPSLSSVSPTTYGTSFRTRGLLKGPTYPVSLRTRTVFRTTASLTSEGSARRVSLRTKTVALTTTATFITTHPHTSSTDPSKLSILIRTKHKSFTGTTKTKTLSSTRKTSASRKMPISPETSVSRTRVLSPTTTTATARVTTISVTTEFKKGRTTITRWQTPRTKTTTAWRTRAEPSGVRTKFFHDTKTKILHDTLIKYVPYNNTKVFHHIRTKTRQLTGTNATTVGTSIGIDGLRPAKTVTVDRSLRPTGNSPVLVVSGQSVTTTIPSSRITFTRGLSTTSTLVVTDPPFLVPGPLQGPHNVASWLARARQIRGMNPGINDRKLGSFKGLGKDRKTVKFPNKHGSDACKAMSKKCKFPAKDDNTVLPCQERLAYEVFQLYEANPDQTFARGEVVACLDQNTNYCASIDWQPWIQKNPKAGKLVEDLMTQRSMNEQDEVPIASVVESVNWMLDSDAQLCGETLLTVEKQRHSAGNNLGDMVGRYVLKLGPAPLEKQGDLFDGYNKDHFADDKSVDDDSDSYDP